MPALLVRPRPLRAALAARLALVPQLEAPAVTVAPAETPRSVRFLPRLVGAEADRGPTRRSLQAEVEAVVRVQPAALELLPAAPAAFLLLQQTGRMGKA